MDRLRDLARSIGIQNAEPQAASADNTRARAGAQSPSARAAAPRTGLFADLANPLQRIAAPAMRNLSLDTLRAATERALAPRKPAVPLTQKLPPELWATIADDLDKTSRASLRLASKDGAAIGAASVKGVVVGSASALKQAMHAYTPGGLERLTLKGGRYDAASLDSLPHTLHELSLDDVRVDSMDLYPLLHRMTQLKELRTSGHYGPNLASAIGQCPSLEHVDLDQAQIGDRGAISLAQKNALKSVSLFYNGIGVDGAAALAKSPSLVDLNLNGNGGIGNAGAMHLSRGKFASLNVRNCNIGDPGALALAHNPNIKRLNLSGNPLSPGCIAMLEQMRSRFDELKLPQA